MILFKAVDFDQSRKKNNAVIYSLADALNRRPSDHDVEEINLRD